LMIEPMFSSSMKPTHPIHVEFCGGDWVSRERDPKHTFLTLLVDAVWGLFSRADTSNPAFALAYLG